MAGDEDETPDDEEIGLVPIFTMVLWLTCVAVFLVGVMFDEPPPAPATRPTTTTPVELLSVDLSNEPEPSRDFRAPSREFTAAPEAPVIPARPAEPVAAEPVEAEPAFLDLQTLTPMRSFAATASVRLTFGYGEGRQPGPEYPRDAALAGEEGTVVARFEVDESGRVGEAEAVVPCPWPELNQSVLRTIRHDWRFSPGPPRSYEVSIEFRINRH